MEIMLIRHAMTAGNLARRYIGRTDEPLCPEGKRLAAERGGMLEVPNLVYTSPMLRCRQTAELMFPGTETTVIDGLRETDFGKFENKSYDELKDDEDYVRWLDGGGKGAIPGGESFDEACRRIMTAFGDVLLDIITREYTERAALVVHGGTIMTIMSALGLPEREYYDWQVKNCGGFVVTPEGERLRVARGI